MEYCQCIDYGLKDCWPGNTIQFAKKCEHHNPIESKGAARCNCSWQSSQQKFNDNIYRIVNRSQTNRTRRFGIDWKSAHRIQDQSITIETTSSGTVPPNNHWTKSWLSTSFCIWQQLGSTQLLLSIENHSVWYQNWRGHHHFNHTRKDQWWRYWKWTTVDFVL